jgi:hypothetical protein
MGKLQDLAEVAADKRCVLAERLDQTDWADESDHAFVTNPANGVPKIHRALAKAGVNVAMSTVQRHRDGQCQCGRGA